MKKSLRGYVGDFSREWKKSKMRSAAINLYSRKPWHDKVLRIMQDRLCVRWVRQENSITHIRHNGVKPFSEGAFLSLSMFVFTSTFEQDWRNNLLKFKYSENTTTRVCKKFPFWFEVKVHIFWEDHKCLTVTT